MKLSIIVPVYNMSADGKLNFCLDSLLQQDLTREYEIIAVDDKSTDNSLEILQSYRETYPDRIRVIASPENGHQGAARNRGIRAAKGEWIGFTDSDDWVAPDMYSRLMEKAEETGADVVGCDYFLTDHRDFADGKRVLCSRMEQNGILSEAQYREMILSPGSMVVKIYKRELFTENNLWFPEGIFYEDNCLSPLVLLYAKKFARVDEALYFYYQHSESTVHEFSFEKCKDRMISMEIFWRECQRRGFYQKFPLETEYRFFELYYKNTLFTYMQSGKRCHLSYLRELKKGLLDHVPGFMENPYYLQKTDAENRKLIAIHMKSGLLFLWYYRLLHFYRRIRYGKNRGKRI